MVWISSHGVRPGPRQLLPCPARRARREPSLEMRGGDAPRRGIAIHQAKAAAALDRRACAETEVRATHPSARVTAQCVTPSGGTRVFPQVFQEVVTGGVLSQSQRLSQLGETDRVCASGERAGRAAFPASG